MEYVERKLHKGQNAEHCHIDPEGLCGEVFPQLTGGLFRCIAYRFHHSIEGCTGIHGADL